MWWVALVACGGGEQIPVGVSLRDGQVIVGDVRTDTLRLEGVFGTVDVPLGDVGMVVPVEGATLGESHDQVTVWLRNGSELRGRWTEPELAMGVAVGGQRVAVDLPTDDIGAIQLRGGAEWPSSDLYRVRTTHGDDVLVDPASTRIEIENELGTFSPFLSECVRVGPVGDPSGPWRVELVTGTVLVGPLRQEQLHLELPAGPHLVDLPLADLVAIDRTVWATPAPESSYAKPVSAPTSARRGKLSEADGWFRNDSLEDAKR
ncbi:MAG: hypothetical protein H6738_03495 [Alphaproteobacteria bacterium]|nr:hypothetical protein [Alphaproteobacteria bacterium]MCB9695832.1 hypothetical protein [Alphaproteobacteria bacterium]